jgi:hypothetical protein
MIYLRAGLYAEGPTDYHFLLPMLDRLIRETAARLFPGASEIEDTRAIDSTGTQRQRASRIDAAIRENEDLIDFLIIHADGDSDPHRARRERVDPGIAAARTAIPSKPLPALACIPVRELEAWLLVDDRVFSEQLGLDQAQRAEEKRTALCRHRLPTAGVGAPRGPLVFRPDLLRRVRG